MNLYQNIRRQIESLAPIEQLRLLEELTALVRSRRAVKASRSLLELEGLGKEIWQGIDAQDYINRERDSWNG